MFEQLPWNQFSWLMYFQLYLTALMLLAIGSQFELWRRIAGFVRALPTRFPKMTQLVLEQRTTIFAKLPLFPIVGVALVWIAHFCCMRLVWPDAQVSTSMLWNQPLLGVLAVLFGCAMVYLDMRNFLRIKKMDFDELEKSLNLGETALNGFVRGITKVATLSLVDTKQVVVSRVEQNLDQLNIALRKQTQSFGLLTFTRIGFGLCLWLIWVTR